MMYLYLYIAGFVLSVGGCWFMNQLTMRKQYYRPDLMPLAGALGFSLVWPLFWVIAGGIMVGEQIPDVWNKQILFKPSEKKLQCKKGRSL